VKQLAVIGHQQQAGGVLVEPSDRAQHRVPQLETRRQQIVNRDARILGAARVAIGLVDHDRQRRGRVQQLAFHEDRLMRRQLRFIELVAFEIRDRAGADQALDLLAGAVAEVGEVLDQFHGEEMTNA
jgi:hypothetical protein